LGLTKITGVTCWSRRHDDLRRWRFENWA